jgi:hypothetical protein
MVSSPTDDHEARGGRTHIRPAACPQPVCSLAGGCDPTVSLPMARLFGGADLVRPDRLKRRRRRGHGRGGGAGLGPARDPALLRRQQHRPHLHPQSPAGAAGQRAQGGLPQHLERPEHLRGWSEFDGHVEAAVVGELRDRGYPTPPAHNESGYSALIFVKGAGGWAGGREFLGAHAWRPSDPPGAAGDRSRRRQGLLPHPARPGDPERERGRHHLPLWRRDPAERDQQHHRHRRYPDAGILARHR